MLYIVSTPIGNLEDITFRAIETLKNVDIIACEDTRHTKILLNKYKIDKKLVSYHQHSSIAKTERIIDFLQEGREVAIVTDAGTPGISDPGSKLIKRAIASNIDIISVPGPSAFVSALSVSGFDTSGFVFIGFLPHKKGRQMKLKGITNEERTVVLYESVHRIKKLLRELGEIIPERKICVVREITKKFEEVYRGKPGEILDTVKEKGEFVIVIDQHGKITNNTLKITEAKKVDLLYPELSYKIRGIAMKIRKELGSGQKESVYQNLFKEKLEEVKIKFEKEKSIVIKSKNSGKSLGIYKPDFVVNDEIILELKALKFLPKNQENQLFDYLKNSEYELGFIINFGGDKLYMKRIIYTNDRKDFS